MIDSRDVKDLHPAARERAVAWLAACKKAGLDVLITCTYRDNEAQNRLYAKGRTKPGKIVTNARGGSSLHNYAVAWDFVVMSHGKPMWNDLKSFRAAGEIAESLGCEWAGRWKTFKEMAHIQFTGGLSLRDLRAGKRPQPFVAPKPAIAKKAA
jgi:peptidoglycan L-alanyl-D-glutamate endopeptidase CwlK